MAAPIQFYFEFSSPYGYLAAEKIEALAAKHGREVDWKPFLLGPVFKETGGRPLVSIPIKGDYALHDMKRAARLLKVPFQMPEPFPFLSVQAARLAYWAKAQHPDKAKALMLALYRAAFAQGRDISAAATVVSVASAQGIAADAASAALQDPSVKETLRQEMDLARERQVFGSPFIIVDGEPFWGHDRLETIDHWLTSGGW